MGPGQLTPVGTLENIIIYIGIIRENANLILLGLFLSLWQCKHYSNFTLFKRRHEGTVALEIACVLGEQPLNPEWP